MAKIISTRGNRIFTPDKRREDEIKIKDFTRTLVEVGDNIKIKELISLLRKNGFVLYKSKIITPKIILKNLNKPREVVKLEFSGFDLLEGIYTDVVYKELNQFAKKTQKIIKPTEIKFHLRKLRKTGKPLYNLDGKIVAGKKIITANVIGYGFMDLVQELIDKLEVQIIKIKH